MNPPNAFKRTAPDREAEYLCYGKESKASVLALFAAAFANGGDGDIAISALDQLSDELTVLSAYFGGGDATLSDDIIENTLSAMAERARAAAEVQRRINSAETDGGAP